MIMIRCGNREAEKKIALMLHGETPGKIFLNFPMPGYTRKRRKSQWFEVINSPALLPYDKK